MVLCACYKVRFRKSTLQCGKGTKKYDEVFVSQVPQLNSNEGRGTGLGVGGRYVCACEFGQCIAVLLYFQSASVLASISVLV